MAAAAVAPSRCEVSVWDNLAKLPPFSPDLDQPGLILPVAVAELHAEVDAADGLLIACPEYADGIPGARADMAHYTLVLVGVADGFVLLAGHADGIANRGSGEELQDHACAAAH